MLPFLQANAGTPLMVRFPSLVPRLYWLAVPVLICFFEILKESLPGLFDFLGSDNTKLCWKPCISKAWPQNYLRFGYLPGFGTQFGSLKPLFYSIPIIDCLLIIFTNTFILITLLPIQDVLPCKTDRKHYCLFYWTKFYSPNWQSSSQAEIVFTSMLSYSSSFSPPLLLLL